MANPLFNKEFLKQLDNSHNKQTYVRITALSMNELPVESIVGKVTSGSINIDGDSAIRRTCNLSLVVDQDDIIITDIYWAYKNKFKLEIGLKNTINSEYDDIIWFKQGVYAITNFSKSQSMTNINISISGKDKMCFLNGELGGTFASEIDLGAIDTEEITENGDKIWITQKLTIYNIIRNVVNIYGEEDFRNIIINDLDIIGYEMLAHKGNSPLYLIMNNNTKKPYNLVNENFLVYDENNNKKLVSQLEEYMAFNIFLQKPTISESALVRITKDGNKNYYVIELGYNALSGYHEVPLTYTQDLIVKPGETVQGVLEKLKSMLGTYEYFYDLDGKFVFQKSKNYIQTSSRPSESSLYEPLMAKSQYSYIFEDYELITAISDSPQITNIKNDFSIWGERESTSGVKVYPHMRYALDKKPTKYTNLKGTKFSTNASNQKYKLDWREIIYQMAKDYYGKDGALVDPKFYYNVNQKNSWCIDGKTGYEQYYQDILGFWRDLYDPSPEAKNSSLYYPEGHEYQYWRKTAVESPQTLNFWFDFLDTTGELENVSVPKIGNRLASVDQNTIKSICTESVPEIKYVFGDEVPPEGESTMQALMKIQVPNTHKGLFDLASPGASCFDKLNELIYKHLTLPMGFSVTTLPIYYLEPNTRIKLPERGDCLLSKISYSLGNATTMSLTCSAITKEFIKEVG